MAQVWNFSAGPGVLPKPLSHRSAEFEACINKAKEDLTTLLNIPSNYQILFMQGGATSQFSTVVYNLLGSDIKKPIDYVVTGVWSQKAAEEAKLLGANVNIVVDTTATKHDGDVKALNDWTFSEDPAFVYYCENETVHGVQFSGVPFGDKVKKSVPIVCDMSSCILSRPTDVSQYALIFAGAQKNMGPAGVTVVIIRDDLIGTRYCPDLKCPVMFDYKTCSKNNSLYNTPPTWSIYVTGLVFKWLLKDIGGLEKMAEINNKKSGLVYQAIDESSGFYKTHVCNPAFRSGMNIPFRIIVDGKPNKELETEFIKQAEAKRMVQLAGHRSTGGIRASLYNALPVEASEALVTFMKSFAAAHCK
ncbi:pyridoxal phosphate-dependent transferase [Chytridium lagenaria]|nr:pyridoxal phosphate-dependent transferase [Chytridium lagenaria]